MAFVVKANKQFAKAKTKAEQERLLQETGCKGTYSLQRLPNYDRYLNTPVEPMHTIKNISERLVTLLAGKSDSAKVRAEEQSRGRFPTTWCDKNEKRHKLPPAPFRLNSEEQAIANERCVKIVVPQGVDWKRRSLFSKKVSLKSNEWKNVLTCGILKFCLRGLLGREQRRTLFELSDVVASLLAEEIDMDSIESLEYRVHRVLSLLEKDFPVSIHVIMVHLLHHLPMYISRLGPTYGFWMYPIERFNSWLARRVLNRRYPESTVIETYRIFELSYHLKLTKQLPDNSVLETEDVISLVEDENNAGSKIHTDNSSSASIYRLCEDDYQLLVTYYKGLNSVEIPQNSIKLVNKYTKTDQYSRAVIYSKDGSSLKTNCYIQKDNKVGKIIKIFEHSHKENQETLFIIQWYSKFEVDFESGLQHFEIDDSACDERSVVAPCGISRPLVHALIGTRLWVLN